MKLFKSVTISLLLSLISVKAMAFDLKDAKDLNGVACVTRVQEVLKSYFKVVDPSDSIGYHVSDKEKMIVNTFRSTTPGTYNQEYVANVKIVFTGQRSSYKSQNVKLKLSGEYDCDSLMVKNIRYLGGVERVD